ncbi:MAG: transporter substrate-binding domain-containing protein [Selenomonadaceae bacterium]|nr:transporter substrate-binding domain-containing protein [Selenomonadaceae bacterium]
MKKFLVAICAVCLLISGCDDSEKVQKIGTIKYENVTEEAFNKFYAEDAERRNEKLNCEYIFFNNMNSMAAALQSGQIDMMSTYESVAHYIIARNNIVEIEEFKPVLTDVFCCAMRAEDVALKKEFDAAILKMANDGTLADLVKTYINKRIHRETPSIIKMPAFYNDTMVKIGVTGDLPMLDYIRPDGIPAGFNTAVLAEISKHIEKNFTLVQINSGARAIALSSGEVDVIFWAVVPQGNEILPSNFDTPEGVILTEPYFSDKIVHVKLR